MKLEQQVVSLELGNELQRLQVKQESYFFWCYTGRTKNSEAEIVSKEELEGEYHYAIHRICPAYSVAELGEMLRSSNARSDIYLDWGYAGYNVKYKSKKETPDDNEADARAKMLIYLIEQKLCQV